jgi:hypothetical protein
MGVLQSTIGMVWLQSGGIDSGMSCVPQIALGVEHGAKRQRKRRSVWMVTTTAAALVLLNGGGGGGGNTMGVSAFFAELPRRIRNGGRPHHHPPAVTNAVSVVPGMLCSKPKRTMRRWTAMETFPQARQRPNDQRRITTTHTRAFIQSMTTVASSFSSSFPPATQSEEDNEDTFGFANSDTLNDDSIVESKGLSFYSQLNATPGQYYSQNEKPNATERERVNVLSYLPNQGRTLPLQIQQLILSITLQYLDSSGSKSNGNNSGDSANRGRNAQPPSPPLLVVYTLEEILDIVDVEHKSRDVPVIVGSLTADVTDTGDALDETFAKLLSLAALYSLPQGIASQLLAAPLFRTSSLADSGLDSNVQQKWQSFRRAFDSVGWQGVEFPHGLAIRPRTKVRLWNLAFAAWPQGRHDNSLQPPPPPQHRRRPRRSWWHRPQTLRLEATLAVAAAAEVADPPYQQCLVDDAFPTATTVQGPSVRLNPLEFLQSMDVELLRSSSSSTSSNAWTTPFEFNSTDSLPSVASSDTFSSSSATTNTTDDTATAMPSNRLGLLFFPHNNERRRRWFQWSSGSGVSSDSNIGVIRRWRRFGRQQYTALKSKGRAGLVAYCFFNWVFYTIGLQWQWYRVASADPLSAAGTSVAALVARKFATVFCYLYGYSQLCKLPKLCTAVGLAPMATRTLSTLQEKLHVNETVAMVILVGAMVLLWMTASAIPVWREYATLRRIVQLDEQLVQVYGLQPV